MKIIFMGTPDFAATALKAIHENSAHEVIALYSQPPRPRGRGHKLQPSPTHEYADSLGIPVYTPLSLKKREAQTEFASLNADIAIVAAYGLILPKAVLDAPKYGCLNIHASLLPRWRGASPIQRAIWAGDATTGVTIMQMDEGLDTGPMIIKGEIPITPQTTTATLHDDLATIGADLTLNVLKNLAQSGQLEAEQQNDAETCYAPLLKKEDGRIDWSQSAAEIDRQIRSLNPWPGTYTDQFKIKSATLTNETTDKPIGTLFDKRGSIACGAGSVLKITALQPAGKKAMDIPAALNGGYIKIGVILA
ncbi:MAG: methionyl-tRNA formyltransferase [Micavibrio sp.]|nr:methionyl-tRNA formyltransferase [Micavibrio sp.]